MAYAFTVTKINGKVIDGRGYITYKVVETEIGTASEWSIDNVPVPSEIVLFETELTTAGNASSLQPELGIEKAWTDDTVDEVYAATSAAAHHRVSTVIPLVSHTADESSVTLYGRSTPDTGTGATGVVTTYVTIRTGIGR